jgi:translation initiation factor 3 subunit J
MADAWDDSGDDWDADSDDDFAAKLNLPKTAATSAPEFSDEEEDLAVIEKAEAAKASRQTLRAKGNALADKKRKEEERKEELELAKKAMELELEREGNMTAEERRLEERRKVEEGDDELIDDLFGGVDAAAPGRGKAVAGGAAAASAGDTVVMKDLKDHLKHARKVSQCINSHGKVHLCASFIKEVISACKPVLDDDAITEIIKTCNVIKNEKVQAAKKKVKGQAQKSKKDKAAEARAKKIAEETFGDSNRYDDYDEYGEQYEDDFF